MAAAPPPPPQRERHRAIHLSRGLSAPLAAFLHTRLLHSAVADAADVTIGLPAAACQQQHYASEHLPILVVPSDGRLHPDEAAAASTVHAYERVTPLWALLALLLPPSALPLPPTEPFRPTPHPPPALHGAAVSFACLSPEQRGVLAPVVEGMGGWVLPSTATWLAWAGITHVIIPEDGRVPPQAQATLEGGVRRKGVDAELRRWLAAEAPHHHWDQNATPHPFILDPHALAALFFDAHHQQSPPTWTVDPTLSLLEATADDDDDDDAAWIRALDHDRHRRRRRSQPPTDDNTAAVSVSVALHPSCQGRVRARAWALVRRLGWGFVVGGDPFANQNGRRVVIVAAVMGKGRGWGEWVAPAYLEACCLGVEDSSSGVGPLVFRPPASTAARAVLGAVGAGGVQRWVFTTTGFPPSSSSSSLLSRRELSWLLDRLGVVHTEAFLPGLHTHLLIPSPSHTSAKLATALSLRGQTAHAPRIVGVEWLLAMLREGRVIDSRPFELHPQQQAPPALPSPPPSPSPAITTNTNTAIEPQQQQQQQLEQQQEEAAPPGGNKENTTTTNEPPMPPSSSPKRKTPLSPSPTITTTRHKRPRPPQAPTTTNTQDRVFLVGTCSTEEGGEVRRARVVSLIESLGGRVLVPPGGTQEGGRDGYDAGCTHVVVFRAKRTVKLLAGVLSGKWVLRPEFLEASQAAGHFVEEAAFEWGGSDSKDDDGKMWPGAYARGRAAASLGWRPLQGLQVILHGGKKLRPPVPFMSALVEAGGGSIVVGERDMGSVDPATTVVLSCLACKPDRALQAWVARGGVVLAADVLLDLVSREGVLDVGAYCLFGTPRDAPALAGMVARGAMQWAPPEG